MKRALALIFVVAACIVGFLSIRGAMPFMPVFGTSMEPEFHAGNLILMKSVPPSEIKVGDIIVYNVPTTIQEFYNYPPVVAHRVIRVNTEGGLSFRTKGDNSGEDPFTVIASNVRGTVGQQIPYLGFPLLFFQSNQGLIFIIIGLCLFAIYLYSDELSRGKRKVQMGIFAPAIQESRHSTRLIANHIQATEKRMDSTEQTIGKFTEAIAEYAQHLKSHTSAIQGLSDASQELKKSTAEQNRVLGQMASNMRQPAPRVEEPPPRIGGTVHKLEVVGEVIHKIESQREELGTVEVVREVEGVTHDVIHEVVHKVVHKVTPEASRRVVYKTVPEAFPKVVHSIAADVFPKVVQEIAPKVEEVVSQTDKRRFPPGCIRNRPKPGNEVEIETPETRPITHHYKRFHTHGIKRET